MRALALMGLALASLTACSSDPVDLEKSTTIQAVDIGGRPYRCLTGTDLNISVGNTKDLTGDLRNRLLTPSAQRAGVRVYISSQSVNEYGQIILYYSNRENTCIFFSEGITVQELGQRVGLNPVGISPFFEETPAPVPTPTPTPTPTPSATPTPAATPTSTIQ